MGSSSLWRVWGKCDSVFRSGQSKAVLGTEPHKLISSENSEVVSSHRWLLFHVSGAQKLRKASAGRSYRKREGLQNDWILTWTIITRNIRQDVMTNIQTVIRGLSISRNMLIGTYVSTKRSSPMIKLKSLGQWKVGDSYLVAGTPC